MQNLGPGVCGSPSQVWKQPWGVSERSEVGSARVDQPCGEDRTVRLLKVPATEKTLSWRAEKLDEILAAAAEPTLRPDIADADSRAATVKQRPTSRRITPAEISVSCGVAGCGGAGCRLGGAWVLAHFLGWGSTIYLDPTL